MPASTTSRLRRQATAAALALALALSGCSGDDDSDATEETTPASTGPTVPEGITPPGKTLPLGKRATVVFKGNARHTSRIALRVTRVRKGSVKDLRQFTLDRRARRSSVYYVDATVRNVGKGDLSGQSLTLYGKVSDELVVQPAIFGSPFATCNWHPFPKKFTTTSATDVCLVMFAPKGGTISEIQWRGVDSEPIAWTVR